MQQIINLIKSITRLSTKTAKQWENNYFGCPVTAFGQVTNSELMYPYGLKANPPIGTRNLSLSINANMSNTISVPMMPVGDKIPKANAGDVILGNPESGAYILMTKAGGLKIVGNVEIQGKVNVSDNIESDATIKGNKVEAGLIDLGTHMHLGVTTGSGTSGAPTMTPPDDKTGM